MLTLMIDMLISHNIALCLFFPFCPPFFALCPLPFALCAFCLCCLSASLSLSASCLSAPEKSLCLKKACLSRASVRRLCVKASVRRVPAFPRTFFLCSLPLAIGRPARARCLLTVRPSVRPSVRSILLQKKKLKETSFRGRGGPFSPLHLDPNRPNGRALLPLPRSRCRR
jgi:hypothetical protein